MFGFGFNTIKIGPKLIGTFLAIGVIPCALLSAIALHQSSGALEAQAFNQLQSVRSIKKTQIESYFADHKGDMGVLIDTVGTLRREAISKLRAIRDIKKSAIETYFKTVHDQALIMSQDHGVVTAMGEFRKAFKGYRKDIGVSSGRLSEMREELTTYYRGVFAGEYKTRNGGTEIDLDNPL